MLRSGIVPDPVLALGPTENWDWLLLQGLGTG